MSDRIEAAIVEFVAALRAEVAAAQPSKSPVELLPIAEATRRLGIGRSLLYDAIGRGEVRSVKVGRRRLVPADEVARLASS